MFTIERQFLLENSKWPSGNSTDEYLLTNILINVIDMIRNFGCF